MKKSLQKQDIIHIVLVILIMVGSLVLYRTIDLVGIVNNLPTQNTLLALLPFATFAGVSIFTAGSFYVAVAELANSMIPIWQLVLVAGVGLTLGDMIFYYFGRGLEKLLHSTIDPYTTKVARWLDPKPYWVKILIIYLYVGWSPFPGDILMLVLSVLRIKPREFLLPVFLGNITFVIMLTIFGIQFLG